MNINDQFPSNYLKAADLQGKEVKVTMERIEIEKLGDDNKMVLYFVGKTKGVVLNKTNSMNISGGYGPETDNWMGQPVILYSTWVDFQGKSVEAIRIRPASKPAPKPVDLDGDEAPF